MKTLSTSLNQKQAESFFQITHGTDCDRYLYKEEILVQKAWINNLVEVNILTSMEANQIHGVLNNFAESIEKENFI